MERFAPSDARFAAHKVSSASSARRQGRLAG